MSFQIVYRGATIRVGSRVALIGRSPACKVVLDDEAVSRRHARITEDDSGVHIEDLGSANGLTVNNLKVDGSVTLQDGDVVRIGTHQLRFSQPDAPRSNQRRRSHRSAELDALWNDDEVDVTTFHRGRPTRRRNRLALLSATADMEFARGDIKAAEHVLGTELRNVLERAEKGNVPKATVRDAARYALRLTKSDNRDDWAAYLLQLLTATATPADARMRLELLPLLRGPEHNAALARYEAALAKQLALGHPDAQATASALKRHRQA